MKPMLGKPRFWQQALAIVLVYWALVLLDVIAFNGANKILAIGALVTSGLLLLDK